MGKFLKLRPSLVSKIWGGYKLKSFRKVVDFDESEGPLGETWEVSGLDTGPSYVGEQKLSDVADINKIPYLVKFIDTAANLSVQVHPDDAYAAIVESSKGKSESWVILESAPGAGIYLGLKNGVTKSDLEDAIASGDKVNELLNFVEVKAGDFFYVPAGTIHAIGEGVTLAEIQQNSGVTYRVWDWNRLGVDGKPRELHVLKSLDVINFEESANCFDHFKMKKEVHTGTHNFELIDHEDFRVTCVNNIDGYSFDSDRGFYHSLLVLKGSLEVVVNGEVTDLDQYDAGVYSAEEFGQDIKVSPKTDDTCFLHIC